MQCEKCGADVTVSDLPRSAWLALVMCKECHEEAMKDVTVHVTLEQTW